jgi:hypothetical protein
MDEIGRTVAIVDSNYREVEQALYDDPITRKLAEEVLPSWRRDRKHMVHLDSGTPRHEFMVASLRAYTERGGKIGSHIGGPAIVIIRHLREMSDLADKAMHAALTEDLCHVLPSENGTPEEAMARYLLSQGWRKD